VTLAELEKKEINEKIKVLNQPYINARNSPIHKLGDIILKIHRFLKPLFFPFGFPQISQGSVIDQRQQYQANRITQLKADHVPYCPKCKSTQLTYVKRLSYGRAIIGHEIAGEAGEILGGITGKKGWIKCMNCGHTWKI
jgi:DNA-directed RNA polymerase subunit M/transcription elongation factor TFIIS